MKNNNEHEYLAEYFSNECSDSERDSVLKWAKGKNDNDKYLKVIHAIKNMPNPLKEEWKTDEVWSKIEETINPVKKAGGIRKYRLFAFPIKVAAAFVIIVLSITFAYLVTNRQVDNSDSMMNSILVNNTEILKLELSDGTKVSLDSGSSFSYPEEFSKKQRIVNLSGEGFFEVSEDKDRPFIIHAEGAVITVIGTQFSVCAWHNKDEIEVYVVDGKVSLALSENVQLNNQVILGTGSLGILSKDGRIEAPVVSDPEKYLNWVNHDINFENTRLVDILRTLERWYDVTINIEDSAKNEIPLTVNSKDKSLSSILELIAQLTDMSYKQDERNIYFK
ncbi:FecR family protein [candidate division KSB1 bacterium]